MKNKIFLIYKDSCDDCCTIKGYINGTSDDAEEYCNKLNEGNEFEWEDFYWEELECLNSK